MRSVSVEEFLAALRSGSICVFDVRSPREYARGAIPTALPLPLFDDDERHRVGLNYIEHGRRAAIKLGLDLVGPKLRWFVEEVERHVQPGQSVGLYCWRGGMRSSAVAWLLDFYGFDVVALRGGYKAYRRFALAQFAAPRQYVILSGYTGSGKTELLGMLARSGEATLDLERLASHRGSAFGALGLAPQPTQQHFENRMAFELWKHAAADRIWIEDESRRIGSLAIPDGLWSQMQSAPIVAVEIPLERRIERLVAEYGQFPTEQLAACLRAIRERLGAERYRRAQEALASGDLATVARIALEHYDKAYRHSLRKRADRIVWIRADSPADALPALRRFTVHHHAVAEQR